MASNVDEGILGDCPVCPAPVPIDNLGLTHRPPEGFPEIFAECPACHLVVHPD